MMCFTDESTHSVEPQRHFFGSRTGLVVNPRILWAHVQFSFVTPHTSTAFTFYTRRIILFSALQRHRAWDICSGNRPIVHGGASFPAKTRGIRGQSTKFILRVFSDHAPLFTKKRFHSCCLYFPRSSSASVFAY